jgi:hypothetical protein
MKPLHLGKDAMAKRYVSKDLCIFIIYTVQRKKGLLSEKMNRQIARERPTNPKKLIGKQLALEILARGDGQWVPSGQIAW